MLALWSPKGGVGTSVLAAAVALAVARDAGMRDSGTRDSGTRDSGTRDSGTRSAAARDPRRAAGASGCRLVDLTGDQPAVLGLGADPDLGLGDWLAVGLEAPRDALDRLGVAVAAGLVLVPRGAEASDASAASATALAVALRGSEVPVVADCGTATTPAARAVVELAEATVVVLRPCYLALRRAVHSSLLGASSGVVVVEEPGRVLGTREVTEVLDLPVLARIPVRNDIARAVDAGVLTTRLPSALERPALRLASRCGLVPARRGAAA